MGHGQHGASRAVGSQHTHPSLHPVPEHLRALPQAQGSGSPIPGIPPQDPRSSTGAQGSQGQTQGSGLRDPDRCEKDRRETQKETRGPQRGRRDDRTGGRDSERRQKEVRDDGDSGERAADGERRWSQGGWGSGQTLEGCLPAAWHRGPLPVGHPRSEGSATHTCSGGQVWRPARRDAARAQSPASGSPGLAVVPTPSPSLGSADSNPPLAPSCSPRRRAGSPGGAGRTRVGKGRAPCLSHTHRQRMLAPAGTVCSAARRLPALARSPPSSRALSAHRRSLVRPLIHTHAPR